MNTKPRKVVRLNPSQLRMIKSAQQKLALKLDIVFEDVRFLSYQEQLFPDSTLGETGAVGAANPTQGFRVVFQILGRKYEYRAPLEAPSTGRTYKPRQALAAFMPTTHWVKNSQDILEPRFRLTAFSWNPA
jgi:hypothetical protein